MKAGHLDGWITLHVYCVLMERERVASQVCMLLPVGSPSEGILLSALMSDSAAMNYKTATVIHTYIIM